MRLGRHPASKTLQRYLYRGIAVFFVLFTFVDISSPHLCCDELNGLASAAQGSTINAPVVDDRIPAIDKDDSVPQQPATPPASEEDCFCCCSHVLPGVSFSVAVLHFKSPQVDPQTDSLLTPPLKALYHPPRFV